MSRFSPVLTALLVVSAVVLAVLTAWRRWTSPEEAPRRSAGFTDQAQAAGLNFRMHFLPGEQGQKFKINLYDHGCGVAVGDYNGDGWDDVYFLNQLGANALFRNRGDGTFEDVTTEAGPIGLDDRICVSAVFNDYDNDGDQDLYVTSTRGGNVLFRNDGGHYTDVTDAAGVTWFGHSQTAAFLDYDNDGLLDLFLTNTATWTRDEFDTEQGYYPGYGGVKDLLRRPWEYNVMFHNRGDGTFVNVTDRVNLRGHGWGGDVAAFDYDEDGWLDLLVTNMFGPSHLHRNEQGERFRDVSDEVLPVTSFGTIGAKAFDYNNDGRLDLMIADMHSDMWMGRDVSYDLRTIDPARKYPTRRGPLAADEEEEPDAEAEAEVFDVDLENVLYGNSFFENLGGSRFEERSDAAGLETFWPWGVATGDFDNDGYEDVFLPSGMGYPFAYWPNALLMNGGDGRFVDRAAELGIEPPLGGPFLEERVGPMPAARSSRCAAAADFDGDGRLEIVTNNFNGRPYLFRNRLAARNYIAFRLTGTKSNRDAVGAVVKCFCGGEVLVRQVHAAGGYLSQCSKTLHFGLGDRGDVERVEIAWPSGETQTIAAPRANRLWEVMEGSTAVERPTGDFDQR